METTLTYQIKCAPNQMVSHTRTVLTPSSAHENDTVLLDVVALAGDVRRHHTTSREPHTRRLALSGIGFLRPRDADLEADALLGRGRQFGQSGRGSVSGALWFSAALEWKERGKLVSHQEEIRLRNWLVV